MPQPRLKVVQIVAGSDLDRAGTKLHRHQHRVANHRHRAIRQRQRQALANQVRKARIFRMNRHRRIAQQRLGPRRRHHQPLPRRRAHHRIGNVPQLAVGLFGLDLKVGQRRVAARTPVDQPPRPIDEAIFVQPHKRLIDRPRAALVHREAVALPVQRKPEHPQLLSNAIAVLFLPLPDATDKLLAAQVVAGLAFLFCQHALDHQLRRDARVVGARQPQRVVPLHASPAHQRVLHHVHRVPHVQRPGDVRRRNRNRERRLRRRRTGMKIALLDPDFVPLLFHFRRVVGLGHRDFFHVPILLGNPGSAPQRQQKFH